MALPPSNGKILLITGINGYIASVLGHLVLTKGYHLRGTSRSKSSAEALVNGAYAPYKERVEIFEVPDITVSGAFDEAAKGVHGILHTASPVSFSNNSYEDVIYPALNGTLTVLDTASKAGSQLESLVVTSSVAAVTNPVSEPNKTLTEADFAHDYFDKAEADYKNGAKSEPKVLYNASKTAAERAIWKFRDEKKPPFAITAINPTVVIGPPAQLVTDASKLNETLKPIWKIFSGEAKEIPSNIGTGAFVDVRDVAEMHLWAFEHPKEADGERFISAGGFGPNQAAADILREVYPDRQDKITKGEPGKGYVGFGKGFVDFPENTARAVNDKAKKVMGIKFISFHDSLTDTVKEFEKLL